MHSPTHNTTAQMTDPIATRLSNCSQFAPLLPKLQELHDKNSKLSQAAAKNGPTSVDHAKHQILSGFLAEVSQIIDDFNHYQDPFLETDELNDVLILARYIKAAIIHLFDNHLMTLATERNYHKRAFNFFLRITMVGTIASVTGALAIPSFIDFVAACLSTTIVSSIFGRRIDFIDPRPETLQVLSAFYYELNLLEDLLNQALNLKSLPNYYAILMLDPAVSKEEIRKAYLQLAVQYHPDKNQTIDHGHFIQIQEAYEILYDEERRERYDAAFKYMATAQQSSTDHALSLPALTSPSSP
jgi:hypothetical protein